MALGPMSQQDAMPPPNSPPTATLIRQLTSWRDEVELNTPPSPSFSFRLLEVLLSPAWTLCP